MLQFRSAYTRAVTVQNFSHHSSISFTFIPSTSDSLHQPVILHSLCVQTTLTHTALHDQSTLVTPVLLRSFSFLTWSICSHMVYSSSPLHLIFVLYYCHTSCFSCAVCTATLSHNLLFTIIIMVLQLHTFPTSLILNLIPVILHPKYLNNQP